MKGRWIYEVDMGDHTEMWSSKAVEAFYRNNVDKSEYKDFEEWFLDMERNGLITEVA